uniref:G-protein coupled receptors family 1 profile domain-containing protein n=1 Tax=Electrophorus electricus TaxID=8005 RepID=A0A4W4E0W9_ELEEL
MLLKSLTVVTEFFIVGFPGLPSEFYNLMGTFFFSIYVIIELGNSILEVLFAIEPRLHKPMYIIMLNLALSDFGFCTVALPKLISRYWFNNRSISFQLIHYFGTLNSLIKMIMALDRYLAICFPLRYPALMTNQTMRILAAAAYQVQLSLAMSYTIIVVTVITKTDNQGRLKAFLSCASQVCIISIYYIPRLLVFLKIAIAMFYGLFPPLMNPLIYCFKSTETGQMLLK